MYIYNSQITSKVNKIKKIKNNENRLQLKMGQIRGRIDKMRLTFLYLHQKIT